MPQAFLEADHAVLNGQGKRARVEARDDQRDRQSHQKSGAVSPLGADVYQIHHGPDERGNRQKGQDIVIHRHKTPMIGKILGFGHGELHPPERLTSQP